MSTLFSSAFWANMTFLNPWILAALGALPLLWFLLRITPPVPRRFAFPAAHFLADLTPEQTTSSHTPWWILLLRLIILTCIIIALARPVLNPAEALPGHGAVRLVIDNDWAAAQNWQAQMTQAREIIEQAGRERRNLYIMTTAPSSGTKEVRHHGPLTQAQAEARIKGLAPRPWPADYEAALRAVQKEAPRQQTSLQSYWLSSGLSGPKQTALMRALQAGGSLEIIRPAAAQLPLLLRPVQQTGDVVKVRIDAPSAIADNIPVTVHALGTNNRILDIQNQRLNRKSLPQDVTFNIPETLRNQITQFRIAGRQSAGTVILLDDRFRRRTVGIVAPTGQAENAPLIEASFYIKRALEPYANLETGNVEDLLAQEPAVLILPDIGAMPPAELNQLAKWVEQGGLLLRFAGPHMTQSEPFLTPLPLRRSGRALDGTLTWDEPVSLAPFAQSSPFYGLNIPEDITIKRQILPAQTEGLEDKIWAQLADGTPLITAAPKGSGLLVLVHTTATAEWADLALSGLYVKILQRIINMAGRSAHLQAPSGLLQPLTTLDGFGITTSPSSGVQPIDSHDFADIAPSAIHPPGLYGRAGTHAALNLGDRLQPPAALPSVLPAGINARFYASSGEKDLMPALLMIAFILYLCDWLIMIFLQLRPARAVRNAARRRHTGLAACAVMIGLLFPAPAAMAQSTPESQALVYAGNIHMAYIKSGVPALDQASETGLKALARTLARRTSVEPAGVVGLDPARDDLIFFPFIYWPVAPNAKAPGTDALQNIQFYLDHGGTILIDTRDRQSASSYDSGLTGDGRNAAALRRLISGLDIPPLEPMQEDHVLSRSFYLLRRFPGRYDHGTIWVEEKSLNGRDDVSSVIIGSHDWAAAWGAADTALRLDGGPRQQEMALRFGVNVMMYALTGNYKADQVHIPHILERLGE